MLTESDNTSMEVVLSLAGGPGMINALITKFK